MKESFLLKSQLIYPKWVKEWDVYTNNMITIISDLVHESPIRLAFCISKIREKAGLNQYERQWLQYMCLANSKSVNDFTLENILDGIHNTYHVNSYFTKFKLLVMYYELRMKLREIKGEIYGFFSRCGFINEWSNSNHKRWKDC